MGKAEREQSDRSGTQVAWPARITPEVMAKVRAWLPELLRAKALANVKNGSAMRFRRNSVNRRRGQSGIKSQFAPRTHHRRSMLFTGYIHSIQYASDGAKSFGIAVKNLPATRHPSRF